MRIGTRESKLALWQAQKVQSHIFNQDIESQLVTISSDGDVDLSTPLYQLGIQGIFTKTLDAALLQNKIDVAVHSYKDVPTVLAKGLHIAAVLERGNVHDVFVPGNAPYNFNDVCVIATSSMRRKAQWLYKYKHHTTDNIRGNVTTRLQKLKQSNWAGAIFAKAGLERLNLLPQNAMELNWMLPAPAQGAVVIICRENDEKTKALCDRFTHWQTAVCTHLERQLLNKLNAGCSLPVGALAEIDAENLIRLKANITAPDGSVKVDSGGQCSIFEVDKLATECAQKMLGAGGEKILNSLNRY
ncbi:MAG: hydroxymethylbilane synthase [Bacteroidetes bacterium]|nr:hydroxymethylbilane synthase [Bacteroidota bacterium]